MPFSSPSPHRKADGQGGDDAEAAGHDEERGDEKGQHGCRPNGRFCNHEPYHQVENRPQTVEQRAAPLAGPDRRDDRGNPANHQGHSQDHNGQQGRLHGHGREDHRSRPADHQQNAKQQQPPPIADRRCWNSRSSCSQRGTLACFSVHDSHPFLILGIRGNYPNALGKSGRSSPAYQE